MTELLFEKRCDFGKTGVPGFVTHGHLTPVSLGWCVGGQAGLDVTNEVIGRSGNADDIRHWLELRNGDNHDRFAGGQVFPDFGRTCVFDNVVRSVFGNDADIEVRCKGREIGVRLSRDEVNVR